MTYEDFLKKAQTSGLLGQFSDYDLETAKKNPEFGMTMLSYKTDYANAADAAAKESINKLANELRAQYGSYTGGSDGSKYYVTAPSPGGYQNPYQSKISEILDKMGTYGSFDYGEAPTYNNRYQQELDNLLNRVQNYEDFSWSKETDPSWSAYAKQYRREGERATQDALAQAAAASGGQVSTAAVTAASQAGDYYASQLSDMIPQLYQNAYDRYLNQYSMLLDQLNTTRQAEQYDYQAYLNELNQYNTDRNMSYDQWLQQYNMLGDTLGAYQGQSNTQYQQLLDQIEYNTNKQTLAQNQVDAILSAGGMPSADLIGSSGYTTEYVNALEQYYKQKEAAKEPKEDKPEEPKIGDSAAYSDVTKQAKSYETIEEAEAYLNRMVDQGAITAEEAAYIYSVILGAEVKTYSGTKYVAPEIGAIGRTVESW